MKEHLLQCQNYLEHPDHSGNSVLCEWWRRNPQGKEDQKGISLTGVKQTYLEMDRLNEKAQQELDNLAAAVIYEGGRPLDLFNHPTMQAFIKKLNPAYRIPSPKMFAGPLLERNYQKIRTRVQAYIDNSTCLNFISDGSANINHECINNLSVLTDVGAFQLESEEILSIKHTAEEEAK